MRARLVGPWAVGLGLAWAGPAQAWPVDGGASVVSVQAPGLAPGVWGTAPVAAGELSPSGAFSLRIPGGQASTGSALYDAVVRRTLGTITVVVPQAAFLGRQGVVSRYRGLAQVGVAGRVVQAPLSFRVTQLRGRRVLSAFVGASLDAYGLRALNGGPAGPLRASVRAVFPSP